MEKIKNNDHDLSIPWIQVAKGDLVVLNGSWWNVKSVTPTFYKSDGTYETKTSPEWAAMVQLELETIEGQILEHFPNDPYEKIRVRPLARDPWEESRNAAMKMQDARRRF